MILLFWLPHWLRYLVKLELMARPSTPFWRELLSHLQNATTTQKILQHLTKPLAVTNIKLQSLNNYIKGWRWAREVTSLSFSMVHFGHYMAGINDPCIAQLNAILASIPVITGYSQNWWRKGLNVMLKKSSGNIKGKWLQIILLF